MIKHYCFNVTKCHMVSILIYLIYLISYILVLDKPHTERSNNFVPLSVLLRYWSKISEEAHGSVTYTQPI